MKATESAGRRVLSGSLWNLAGQGSTILFALVAVPLLIRNLGTDRFGFITLAWLVMAYFGLFDMGLSRATTWAVAQSRQRREHELLNRLVGTSLLAHVVLGVAGGALLALLTPWLAEHLLSIPAHLRPECRGALHLLAISVPLVVATAALRGVLEGHDRFDLANIAKLGANAGAYLFPMAVSFFTRDLRPVVGAVLFSRALVLVAHVSLCRRVVDLSWPRTPLQLHLMRPLIPFGGWLTVSSVVSPVAISLDRMAIAAGASLQAVAHYATPFEVVTKLYIVSASILGAAFPTFTAGALRSDAEGRALYRRVVNVLIVVGVPLCGLVLLLASDLLALWLGTDFAWKSAPVARWLALGVLVGLVGTAPGTLLQAMGRAGEVARLQLLQLPWYAWAVWHLAHEVGINAVAMAWSLRVAVEALLLFHAAKKRTPGRTAPLLTGRQALLCGAFLFGCWLTGSPSIPLLGWERFVGLLTVAAFLPWVWVHLLDPDTRGAFCEWGRSHLRRGMASAEQPAPRGP